MNDEEYSKYFVDQFNQLGKSAEVRRKDSNNVFYELSRNLILVAAIIIAFSSPVISNKTILSEMDYFIKILLFISWISLFLSIVAGLIQYYIDYKYFQSSFNKTRYFIDRIVDKKYKNDETFRKEYLDEKNNDPSNLNAIKTQVGLLIFGLILFLIFITILIF